jgi:hypothetical protein
MITLDNRETMLSLRVFRLLVLVVLLDLELAILCDRVAPPLLFVNRGEGIIHGCHAVAESGSPCPRSSCAETSIARLIRSRSGSSLSYLATSRLNRVFGVPGAEDVSKGRGGGQFSSVGVCG